MKATIVVDLGYGDSGKGTMTDYLASTDSSCRSVIRFNGGAQAAHNVVNKNGVHHTFRQFGSATFVPGIKTHLSHFVLINPELLLLEEKQLREKGVTDAFSRLSIDRLCPITTPYHRATNQLREIYRGLDRHGSCGMGIAETMQDILAYGSGMLYAGDLEDARTTALKTRWIRQQKYSELVGLVMSLPEPMPPEAKKAIEVFDSDEVMATFLNNCKLLVAKVKLVDSDYLAYLLTLGNTIFEGAQGALLDERFGFYPHTTWSKTTFDNAETLLRESRFRGEKIRLGVVRAYSTRHGAGPFVTYDRLLTNTLPDGENTNNQWQGQFRTGWFDLVATRYARDMVAWVDQLAVTCVDRLPELSTLPVCEAYSYRGKKSLEPGLFRETASFWISRLEKIQFDRDNNINHQAKLTEALYNCRPIYQSVKRGEYLAFIQEQLKVPLVYTSNGPRASDKQVFSNNK